MYKKIYIEITNICNLKCPFCIGNNRQKEFISIENFKIVLNKIRKFTNYLYFHISGKPLIHPDINKLIDIASRDFYINITTNGYLIKNIENNTNIRQLNISLHSFSDTNGVSLEDYMNNIGDVIDALHMNTYFSLRFWINNKNNSKIIDYLNKRYNTNIELKNGFEVIKNVFISINKEFVWPSLNNDKSYEHGNCYALKDHIGILVNGDIVPCCLDVNGVIKLGNIYENELNEVINSNRYQKILQGFKDNKKIEKLCQKCNFLE